METSTDIVRIENGVLRTGHAVLALEEIGGVELSETADWSLASWVFYNLIFAAATGATLVPGDPRRKKCLLTLTLKSGSKVEIASGERAFMERVETAIEHAIRNASAAAAYRIDLNNKKIEPEEPPSRAAR